MLVLSAVMTDAGAVSVVVSIAVIFVAHAVVV
jgi:hypothetical protein